MSRPSAPTPTTSTANATATSTQKLRASCDACNQAKVKCTKDRPFCTRCATHGIYCVYSVSLRAGKRRAGPKSPTAVTPVTASQDQVMTDISPRQLHFDPLTFSPSPPAIDLNQHHRGNDMYHGLLNLEGGNFDNGDHLHDFLDCSSSPTFSHSHMMHQGRHLPPNRQDSCSEASFPPPLTQHSSTESSSSAISGLVTPEDIGSTAGPHWSTSITDGLFEIDSRAGSQTPLDMFSYPSSAPLSRSPSGTFLSHLGGPTGKEPPSKCQCFQLIISMLATLNQVSEPQRTTFDVALTKNKDAIAMCGVILRCRQCTNDTESVTMLVSLIAKIISVYKAPGSAYLNSIALPTMSRDSDDTISNGSAGSGHSYITYGSYRMDKEDDERLKMEIVAIGLQKVESLIACFRERFCGAQMQRPQAEHESRLYEALVDFLAKRLRAELERLNRRKSKTAIGSSASSVSLGID
ncbi:Zn(2)-C6 fungal-type DNA-binding domain [Lasallia pustulata]|uniref:Zn(2)-C6 fungal-type DNA-binding domain n=1 Tax=Lasallia pustulata TaxID=136370 RepID=A0A1W5CU55_9LECA|nr:Zn(2)-C6 fungal-type DNA-binding domain [Lasallia pustulata]